jgi:hypothetical protein
MAVQNQTGKKKKKINRLSTHLNPTRSKAADRSQNIPSEINLILAK